MTAMAGRTALRWGGATHVGRGVPPTTTTTWPATTSACGPSPTAWAAIGGGDVASAIACEAIGRSFADRTVDGLIEAIEQANQAVYETAADDPTSPAWAPRWWRWPLLTRTATRCWRWPTSVTRGSIAIRSASSNSSPTTTAWWPTWCARARCRPRRRRSTRSATSSPARSGSTTGCRSTSSPSSPWPVTATCCAPTGCSTRFRAGHRRGAASGGRSRRGGRRARASGGRRWRTRQRHGRRGRRRRRRRARRRGIRCPRGRRSCIRPRWSPSPGASRDRGRERLAARLEPGATNGSRSGAGTEAMRKRPQGRRLTWRVLLFSLILLALVGGAFATIQWYGRSTYFVGFEGDRGRDLQGTPGRRPVARSGVGGDDRHRTVPRSRPTPGTTSRPARSSPRSPTPTATSTG